MKPTQIKTFTFQVRKGNWVIATARIIGDKIYVSYCYTDNQNEVVAEDLAKIDLSPVCLWGDEFNANIWSC